MFEDATFHSRGIAHSRTSQWMLLTAALNCAVVATLILVPLFFPQRLSGTFINRILFTPPAEPAPPVQRLAAQPASASAHPIANPYTAPPVIPPHISTAPDPAPAGTTLDQASFSGNGTIIDTTASNIFRSSPPPAVKPPQPHTITVSRGVSEGLRLFAPPPTYPVIARTAHVSGTVVLAATISTEGRIENLRIVSGSPLLVPAAMAAVKTWRYRPYQLNNQPVTVETTINIVFNLGSN